MFFRSYKKGWIEIVTGPMFAGKSSELLRRLDTLKRSREKIQVFSPSFDIRYGKNNISNHRGSKWPAEDVKDAQDLKSKVKNDTTVVAIDEIQFFDKKIIKVVEALANKGVRIIIGGLSTDFRGQPFETTTQLLARAEFITKLTSVCFVCNGVATRVQRKTNGAPSSANEQTIIFSELHSYEPRCRQCHEVPDFDEDIAYK